MTDRQIGLELKEEEEDEKKLEGKEKEEKGELKINIAKTEEIEGKKGKKKKDEKEKEINIKEEGEGKRKKDSFLKIKRKSEEKVDKFALEEKMFVENLKKEKFIFEDEDSESESESNPIIIEPLFDFVNKKKEEWNKNRNDENFQAEEFAKSIPIIPDFNYEFLKKMLNEDLDKFIQYYEYLQFTLTASERQEFQDKIEGKCDLPIIKNNFIPKSIKDIKEVFVKLCNSIIKINCLIKDFPETLKKTFLDNSVYSENNFNFPFPVRYGNRELNINKLIFEVVDFFYPETPMNVKMKKKDIELNLDKLMVFKEFRPIFEKIELYDNDDELIKVLNYLFNSIFVYFDSDTKKRDYNLFISIILCCLPFDIKEAKKFFFNLRERVYEGKVFIDDKDLKEYDIENIKPESKVKLGEKIIDVSLKDINCYLEPLYFLQCLKGDEFTICFRFPKLAEMNYLYINKNIRKSYQDLSRLIMKSQIMKQAMNIDNEAKTFKYPFDNDLIFNEVEQNTFLVPLPAHNYFGISDRAFFAVYINCFINNSSTFENLFMDIDSVTKSKCHEYKHIYRIYMSRYNPNIVLKTPKISYDTLGTNQLTKNKINFFKKKEEIISEIYKSKCVQNYQVDKLDYGDILEMAICGKKQNVFFLYNSLFCLTENAWKMNKEDFMIKYFETCFKKSFIFRKNKENKFINEVIKYFKIKTGSNLANSVGSNKSSAKGESNDSIDTKNYIQNSYRYIPKSSHFRK